jgi:hypothetical protein
VDLKTMRLALLASCLLAAALAGAAPRPTAKKGDPMAADTWRAAAAATEGKAVKTNALEVAEPGLVSGDAPAAAVKILSGNDKDEAGGEVIVLMPPDRFQDFVANFSQRQLGSNRGGFGALSKAKTVAGTFATIKGEGALLYGLDAKEAKALAKPSEILAAQLQLSKDGAKPTKPGWTAKEFNVAKVGAAGAPETAREWERLQGLLAAQTQAAKQPRWKSKELIDALKAGSPRLTVDDPAAKVEWTLVWK